MHFHARFIITILLFIIVTIIAGCQVGDSSDRPSTMASSLNGGLLTPTIMTTSLPDSEADLSLTKTLVVTTELHITPTTMLFPADEISLPVTELELGRLFFAGIDLYGWFELTGTKSVDRISFDETRFDASGSYYSNSSEGMNNGPGKSAKLKFSHYSDQVVYAEKWTTPGELWLSDVTYNNPKLIFKDLNNTFGSPWDWLNIVWSPDDLHVFLYNRKAYESSLVYHVDTEQLEYWYWECNSIIISPKSSQLAVLCPRMTGVSSEFSNYAILEWGGEIWYSETQPIQIILQPTLEGIVLWKWSPDGQWLAYFDPTDSEGYLFIADIYGNKTPILIGVSVYNEPDDQGLRYLPPFQETFIWAKSAPILLVQGYSALGDSCPAFETPFDPDLVIPTWPCWQVINISTGQVIWSEGDLIEATPPQEENHSKLSIGELAISPNGEMIALRVFNPHRIILIDINSGYMTTIYYNSVLHLYWTTASDYHNN